MPEQVEVVEGLLVYQPNEASVKRFEISMIVETILLVENGKWLPQAWIASAAPMQFCSRTSDASRNPHICGRIGYISGIPDVADHTALRQRASQNQQCVNNSYLDLSPSTRTPTMVYKIFSFKGWRWVN